ncbi:hypothetical protein [Patulibacter minatonensis]|uniref:hypothetical protein n=1 Tax=Patulibacter minatonensis TaxID=298163 RepID=UPI000478F2A5|nr:hypothetical protein [Patulibacter minatonensis]
MTQLPGFLRHETAPAERPAPSLFDILGSLGPVPETGGGHGAPFRAACALEVARRNRPLGPPRPTPHGAAPPAG